MPLFLPYNLVVFFLCEIKTCIVISKHITVNDYKRQRNLELLPSSIRAWKVIENAYRSSCYETSIKHNIVHTTQTITMELDITSNDIKSTNRNILCMHYKYASYTCGQCLCAVV